jgi:hypothetical protein
LWSSRGSLAEGAEGFARSYAVEYPVEAAAYIVKIVGVAGGQL